MLDTGQYATAIAATRELRGILSNRSLFPRSSQNKTYSLDCTCCSNVVNLTTAMAATRELRGMLANQSQFTHS